MDHACLAPPRNIIAQVLCRQRNQIKDLLDDIPGIVWHQERCVQNKTHSIVHILPFTEGLVTTLMGDDPDACAHSTLRRTQDRTLLVDWSMFPRQNEG